MKFLGRQVVDLPALGQFKGCFVYETSEMDHKMSRCSFRHISLRKSSWRSEQNCPSARFVGLIIEEICDSRENPVHPNQALESIEAPHYDLTHRAGPFALL